MRPVLRDVSSKEGQQNGRVHVGKSGERLHRVWGEITALFLFFASLSIKDDRILLPLSWLPLLGSLPLSSVCPHPPQHYKPPVEGGRAVCWWYDSPLSNRGTPRCPPHTPNEIKASTQSSTSTLVYLHFSAWHPPPCSASTYFWVYIEKIIVQHCRGEK